MKQLKKYWWIILIAIFIILAFNVTNIVNRFNLFDSINGDGINFYETLDYNAIVLKKNDKKGPYNKTIIAKQQVKEILINLAIEIAIFDYIKINDSIVKKSGDLSVDIYRNGIKDTTMIINL